MRILLTAIFWMGNVLPGYLYADQSIIPRQACENHDLRDHFGPPRSQQGTELCWAFAATGLLEEHFCLKDPVNCGTPLSVLDVASCTWYPAVEHPDAVMADVSILSDVGKSSGNAVKCALKRGVCPENEAPFARISRLHCPEVVAQMPNPITQKDIELTQEICFEAEVIEFYNHWHGTITKEAACRYDSGNPFDPHDPQLENIQSAIASFRAISPTSEKRGLKVLDALVESRFDADFLRAVLIPPKCEANRKKESSTISDQALSKKEDLLTGIRVDTTLLIGKSKIEKLAVLNSILRLNRSAATSISVDYADGRLTRDNTGMGHSIIINGTRWNRARNRCEIHIRNWWGNIELGERDPLAGWQPADAIFNSVQDMAFIRPPGHGK